jgi:hypothetical protein
MESKARMVFTQEIHHRTQISDFRQEEKKAQSRHF